MSCLGVTIESTLVLGSPIFIVIYWIHRVTSIKHRDQKESRRRSVQYEGRHIKYQSAHSKRGKMVSAAPPLSGSDYEGRHAKKT